MTQRTEILDACRGRGMKEIDPDQRCGNCDRRTLLRSGLCGRCEEREERDSMADFMEAAARKGDGLAS